MKTTLIVMSVLSILLLISTLICGLWVNSHGSQIADIASSINFHKMLAIGMVIFTIVTLVLVIVKK